MADAAGLLAAYDTQLRTALSDHLPPNVAVKHDGPLVRVCGLGEGGIVLYRDLGGLEGGELDALIARQVAVFAERAEPFEWKLHGHDAPADLAERLRAAGLRAEEEETVLIASAREVAGAPVLPDGVRLRTVTARADLDRIAGLEAAVYGGDRGWLADSLEAERAADPDGSVVLVAEAGGEIVCAGWMRFERGTDFATLWGGATRPGWRGRGIYRALVAYRAGLAMQRGFRYVEVDASADSRPILERLGFTAVTTTTPYVWTPPPPPR